MLASLVTSLKAASLISFAVWALPLLPERLPQSLLLLLCFAAAFYLQYKCAASSFQAKELCLYLLEGA
jgi:hypothetical protein